MSDSASEDSSSVDSDGDIEFEWSTEESEETELECSDSGSGSDLGPEKPLQNDDIEITASADPDADAVGSEDSGSSESEPSTANEEQEVSEDEEADVVEATDNDDDYVANDSSLQDEIPDMNQSSFLDSKTFQDFLSHPIYKELSTPKSARKMLPIPESDAPLPMRPIQSSGDRSLGTEPGLDISSICEDSIQHSPRSGLNNTVPLYTDDCIYFTSANDSQFTNSIQDGSQSFFVEVDSSVLGYGGKSRHAEPCVDEVYTGGTPVSLVDSGVGLSDDKSLECNASEYNMTTEEKHADPVHTSVFGTEVYSDRGESPSASQPKRWDEDGDQAEGATRCENPRTSSRIEGCVNRSMNPAKNELHVSPQPPIVAKDDATRPEPRDRTPPPNDNADAATKCAWKRSKIIHEILDTEATYQRQLNLVLKNFEDPLSMSNLVPEHVVRTIFSNIRQLVLVNQELLKHLQTLSVGQAFLKLGPFLKLYSTYANNHERALATLMEWEQKVPELGVFRRQQEGVEEMEGLKLNALLITPVQRIPRYKLLLEELLGHTPREHQEYQTIKAAVRDVTAVAVHINDHIKQQDNFMKMLAIQKSLSGLAVPKILVPGRIFIKEGPLRKVSKSGGRSHERNFFLFSDILLYAKARPMESTSHHSYACCCILPVQHCRVMRVLGHSQGQGALFTVTCRSESLLLYSDQKTVNSWIVALDRTIQEFYASRQSLRKISSAKEPLRKAAIARLRRMDKEADPLSTSMRQSPNKMSSPKRMRMGQKEPGAADSATLGRSPKVKPPVTVELTPVDVVGDLGCLTPLRERLRSRRHLLTLQHRAAKENKNARARDQDDDGDGDHNPIEISAPVDLDLEGAALASYRNLPSMGVRGKLHRRQRTSEEIREGASLVGFAAPYEYGGSDPRRLLPSPIPRTSPRASPWASPRASPRAGERRGGSSPHPGGPGGSSPYPRAHYNPQ